MADQINQIQEVKVWRPSPKQGHFISLPDEIFEALYGGAAGGGKSETLLMLPLLRSFHQYPRFKGIILRRTYPELFSEIIQRADQYYPAAGAKWNEEKKWYKFPSGAIVRFGHAEYDKDIWKYDTDQYNYVAFDELTSFTEYQYRYLAFSRCRSADVNLPSIVRSATNPGNIGHGWVRSRFVEPHKEGNKVLKDVKTNQLRIFIPAFLTDNPYLMKSDPNYINRLEGLPEADKRAKKYGDWWTFEGQVFDSFRIEPFGDEPDNARHVIDPFPIPEYWPIILSVDWGFTAMVWAGWAAISPTGRVYLIKEFTTKRELISSWGTEVGRISQGMNLKEVIMCQSAWQQRGDEKTIALQFQEHSGLMPRKADNDRIGGKLNFQEYLRWRPKPAKKIPEQGFDPELADKIFRLKGYDFYKEYCDIFAEEIPETNLPKFQIFKSCSALIKAIPLCVYDENDKEDVAEFDGDDPYDGARYLLKACDRYVQQVMNKEAGLAAMSEIVQQVNDGSINMNSYYRKMEFLEAKKNKSLKKVRLHR